jgi:hypothetical protein
MVKSALKEFGIDCELNKVSFFFLLICFVVLLKFILLFNDFMLFCLLAVRMRGR